ncbi:MAG TPA: heme-binding protein [Bryobacteraceae bacterium]|nr:heme-binding protein [Bryobacteraceae bacterium]
MAALTQTPALTLNAAKKIVEAAEKAAAKMKLSVVIALTDGGANLLLLQRMDGAPIGSVTVAQDKARTAVLFKSPTKDYESWLSGGLTSILKLDMLPFEGGIPLVSDGHVVGAIGISGGATSAQDGQIAQAGVNWLAKALEQGQ